MKKLNQKEISKLGRIIVQESCEGISCCGCPLSKGHGCLSNNNPAELVELTKTLLKKHFRNLKDGPWVEISIEYLGKILVKKRVVDCRFSDGLAESLMISMEGYDDEFVAQRLRDVPKDSRKTCKVRKSLLEG